MPKGVWPQPALRQINVGRPWGSPPPVISSNPVMPVGDLGRARGVLGITPARQDLWFRKSPGRRPRGSREPARPYA